MTDKRKNLAAVLVLGAVVYAGLYLRSASFGLYEDDFWFPMQAIATPPGDVLSQSWYFFWHPVQGRPLLALTFLLMGGAHSLGGLWGMHVGAFLIKFGCAVVGYAILRRYLNTFAALMGAILFILTPTHTAGQLLIHSYGVFLASLFSLLALWLYLRRCPIRAMLMAVLALLLVESFVVCYFFAPLLVFERNRAWLKRAALHAASVGLVIVLVLSARWMTGEPRVAQYGSNPADTARLITETAVNGISTHLSSLWNHPWSALTDLFRNGDTVVSLAVVAVAIVLAGLGQCYLASSGPRGVPERTAVAGLVLFCLVTVPLAYGSAFKYHPATWTEGRLTWIHFLGAFQSAAVIAIAVDFASRSVRTWVRIVGCVICGVLIAAVGAFQWRVQDQYVDCWANQRRLFSEVLRATPDLGPGTFVMVELKDAPATTAVWSTSWADTLILDQLYRWPAEWVDRPSVFMEKSVNGVLHLAAERMKHQDGQWQFNLRPWLGAEAHYVRIDPARIIYFSYRDGAFRRNTGSWEVQGRTLSFSGTPDPSAAPALKPTGPLAPLMLCPP